MTSDVDFFFDPVCPWAWISSRWVEEVAAQRDLVVTWRFISLRLLNADKDYATHFPPGYTEGHTLGLRLLRVAAAARETGGNEAVGRLYTELGQRIHRPEARLMALEESGTEKALAAAGLPVELAAARDDERFDALLAAETKLALDRAGADVGTPVLTFAPPDGPSFFGPVISRVPRGEEAVALWEATERLARFPGFAELKRSLRESPQLP
jgi:2-hydroxychromene-2-carboxylate isomerase